MTSGDDNDRLDQLGRALIRAAAMTDAEVTRVATALPYGRVRACVDVARERQLASAMWLDILGIGRRAVPAMLIVALASTGWLWLGGRSTGPSPAPHDVRLDRELLTDITMFSDEDVLALLISGPLTDAPSRGNRR